MKIKSQKTICTLLLLPALVLVSGFFWVGANNASAVGAAYSPQDTTVTLDVGNFTIRGGSDADSIVTTSTTVTITISNGQSFTLVSSEQKEMFTDSSYSYECKSGESALTITPSATQTVVITPKSTTCSIDLGGGGGGGSPVSTSTSTSTPTPTPALSPAVSATPIPIPSASSQQATPASRGFVSLESVSLNDGDVVSAAGSDDPDVYIVNPHGYKRLFLNPAIFGFYGHLGGFQAVKNTTSVTRDTFVTSGLFRNCETDDPKVYGVEVTGEDTGILHWVNTTGEQAVADDPEFFKKVFCINTNELNWYDKGAEYTSVGQIPSYSRGN